MARLNLRGDSGHNSARKANEVARDAILRRSSYSRCRHAFQSATQAALRARCPRGGPRVHGDPRSENFSSKSVIRKRCAASPCSGTGAVLCICNRGLMQGRLATALLELFSRSAWTRVVASNLRHGAAGGSHVTKRVVVKESLCLEITVNLHRARRSAHN